MKKAIVLKLLVYCICFFIVSCNDEDIVDDLPNELSNDSITGAPFGKYQQLNLDEVSGFFETIQPAKPLKSGSRLTALNTGSEFLVGVDAGSLAFEPVEGTELKIPTFKANLKNIDVESNMFLIKVQDSTLGFLMNIVEDKSITDEHFSGIVGITDLSGKFVNGYRLKNGEFVSQFVVAKKQQQKDSIGTSKSSLSFTIRTDPEYRWRSGRINLREVVVTAPHKDNSTQSGSSGGGLNLRNYSGSRSFNFSNNDFSSGGGSGGPSNEKRGRSINVFPCDDPLEGCDDHLLEDSVEEEDKIINELTDKAKCVYDRLEKLKLFKGTIHKFDDNDSYNLILTQKGNCNNQAGAEGCTNFDGDNTITIKLLNVSQPELDLAATILHEGIHADIFKFVNQHEKGYVDPNDRPRLMQLYFYYKKLANSKVIDPKKLNTIYQHEYMAEKYVKPIAEAIKQLDGNRFSIDYYYWYAWEGLEQTYSFKSQLTEGQIKEYQQKKSRVNDTTSFKCN